MQSRPGLGRNKHIQMKHLYSQQLVASKVLTIRQKPTEDNTSDLGGNKCSACDSTNCAIWRASLAIGTTSPAATWLSTWWGKDSARPSKGDGLADMTAGLRMCLAGVLSMLAR